MPNGDTFDPAGRPAIRAAGRLRDCLRELLRLSLEQADVAARADHVALRTLLGRKGDVLNNLKECMTDAHRHGWNLRQPESFSSDAACSKILLEAADLSRRIAAHERHVIGTLTAIREQIESRLTRVGKKRQAAAGYRAGEASGRRLNAVR